MTSRIRRADDVLSSSVDDTLLMMSVAQGRYFGLKGVGPRIWELLDRPTTQADIVAALLAEYEVSPEVCAAQVAGFLAALRQRGLLVEA